MAGIENYSIEFRINCKHITHKCLSIAIARHPTKKMREDNRGNIEFKNLRLRACADFFPFLLKRCQLYIRNAKPSKKKQGVLHRQQKVCFPSFLRLLPFFFFVFSSTGSYRQFHKEKLYASQFSCELLGL